MTKEKFERELHKAANEIMIEKNSAEIIKSFKESEIAENQRRIKLSLLNVDKIKKHELLATVAKSQANKCNSFHKVGSIRISKYCLGRATDPSVQGW